MKSLRIVIADDDGVTLMALRKTLTDMGHQVVGEAADGLEAFDLVGKLRPDVLITDIAMPHLNGLVLAEDGKKMSKR